MIGMMGIEAKSVAEYQAIVKHLENSLARLNSYAQPSADTSYPVEPHIERGYIIGPSLPGSDKRCN